MRSCPSIFVKNGGAFRLFCIVVFVCSKKCTHFHHIVCENVERLIERQMDRLSDNETMMQEQFWCVLVYHNCPDISQGHRDSLAKIIEDLKPKSQPPSALTEICKTILCEFLQQKSVNGKKPEDSFFNWKVSQGFSERIAYRTHQRTLFKGYRDNKHGFYSSLD